MATVRCPPAAAARRRSSSSPFVIPPLPLGLWFPVCVLHNLILWCVALLVSHLSRLLLPPSTRERLRLSLARSLGWWKDGAATLFVFPYSHYCEAARWCLDGSGVRYREVRFATPNHVIAQLAYFGAKRRPQLPFLLDESGTAVIGSDTIAEWCSRREGGEWLFPGGASTHDRKDEKCKVDEGNDPTRRWLEWLHGDDVRGGASIYLFFRRMFHYRGRDGAGSTGCTLARIWCPDERTASFGGKILCQSCALPLTRAFIPLAKLEPPAVERVERALERLGREVGANESRAGGGSTYLSGRAEPSAADVFVCSLLGMYTVFPREDLVCSPSELPEEYEDMVRRWRLSSGGRYIMRVYQRRHEVFGVASKK